MSVKKYPGWFKVCEGFGATIEGRKRQSYNKMYGSIKKSLLLCPCCSSGAFQEKQLCEAKLLGYSKCSTEYLKFFRNVWMIECCVVLSDAAPGGLKELMDLHSRWNIVHLHQDKKKRNISSTLLCKYSEIYFTDPVNSK